MGERLAGKVAFITGAARGQGRSHAIRLAEEGANIIAVDICADVPDVHYGLASDSELAETVRQVEATGQRMIASRTDVRDLESMCSAVADGVAQLGRLDIVVTNAGVLSKPASVIDMSPSAWQDVIDINLTGVWNTAKVTAPHLIEGGRGGSIVIISSVVGLRGSPNVAPYVASKHALVGLMRTLALELAQHSIRVNSIHPTQVDTPMVLNEANYRRRLPDREDATVDDFAAASKGMNALPVPWVNSIDVSNAVVYLASDEGRYVTGVTLPIDAGALLL
jgi:(+)-trans-carveol dehydrogenase/(-)-trans-carveol dehydrogenase